MRPRRVRRGGLFATTAALVLALVLVLAACGGDDDEAAPDDESAATEPVDEPTSEEGKKIAVLLFSRGFEFMVALDQAAREEAENQGYEVVVLDGQGDSETQIRQIEDQIAAGVDGFVVSPNNSEEIVPGIEAANAAGVPVVTVDAIAAGGDVAGHVGFDNTAGGAEAARYLAEEMGGEGRVLELTGAQGAFHAVRRGEGFNEEMQNHENIEVITRDAEWQADNALSITVDTLTANPDIGAIFTHNDEMIRGVISGLQQVNRSLDDILVVGIDGTPLALERIRGGEQNATVVQDPFEMGRLAVETLAAAINGDDVEEEQLLEPRLVTEDDADDEDLWGNRFEE
jgi:ribose transport system substrate-binding protein